MRRTLIYAVLLCTLIFSGCDFLQDLFGKEEEESGPSAYEKIEGTWMVDALTRPEGWNDYKYVFGSGKTLEIYHLDEANREILQYRGAIEEVKDAYMDVRSQYVDGNSNPNIGSMRMAYRIRNDSAMNIGWYQDPEHAEGLTWYLDLNKR